MSDDSLRRSLYNRDMQRIEVITRLKALEPRIRARGVHALFLYGSHARDEAQDDSDVDILVDFAEGAGEGLSAYLAPFEVIEEAFPGIEIGYSTRDALVSHYRPSIEQTAVQVF